MIKFTKRNLSSSTVAMTVSPEQAVWTDWSIEKAVNDGYKASGWVYRAVSLISENGSTAPFVVKTSDDVIEWENPITKLLLKPHPYLNRIQFYTLLLQWIELTGNAFLKQVEVSNMVKELWPISPDRIRPIESTDNASYVSGYSLRNKVGNFARDNDYTTDNVIHLALTDPSQPIMGMSPLQALAKTVDVDVAQQTWNGSAMQNRGVVEGVFSFKDSLDKSSADSIMARIKAKFSGAGNARQPLVLGAQATYTRMSLTPAEVDFLESRKLNRDEIFAIYGVPPQLGGSQESSTYNNFSASMRIFWEAKLIPLLGMLAAQFNSSFEKYLDNGRYIAADFTEVAALRDNETEKATTAKIYSDMGVPFKQINEKFELGVSEYPGWELPFKSSGTAQPVEDRGLVLIPNEKRDMQAEALKRDKIAQGPAQLLYQAVLDNQKGKVYTDIEKGEDPTNSIKDFDQDLVEVTRNIVVGVAGEFANTVVVDTRGKPLNFQHRGELEDSMIEEFLFNEQYILTEVSAIQASTVKTVLDQVRNASDKGFNVEELRQALDDTGIFSPERALRIARTEVGTAASIGQVAGAKVAGANYKRWENAGTETRQAHINRAGEQVAIDDRFSKQISTIGPRFPLDPQMSVGDRVNCDCFMTFKV